MTIDIGPTLRDLGYWALITRFATSCMEAMFK